MELRRETLFMDYTTNQDKMLCAKYFMQEKYDGRREPVYRHSFTKFEFKIKVKIKKSMEY
jgi:hypothetical protein